MSPIPKKARTTRAAAATKAAGKTTTCPWCSADVAGAATTCPSCGASLTEGPAGDIAGLTQIDPAAVSRASRIKPGRLASWLGAEAAADSPDLGGRVAPPSQEVREEMLRLQLAALDAELEAAKASQAAAELENLPENLPEDAPEAKPG